MNRLLVACLGATLALAAACALAPAAAPTSPPAAATKPPAAAATTAPAPAASPAAKPSPAGSPAAKPPASPAASPAAAAKPAAPARPTFDEQAVANFYKGKTLTIVVGYSPGGGYDEYARFLSRHIGRYIPGSPNVIVQNQPGAGSVLAANTLFNTSPKDGTVIGTFARGLPMEELLQKEGVQYKSAQFNWIGSMNEEVSICVSRTDSPIKKFEDLYNTTLKIGGTGPGADTDFFPKFLNGLLGTKFDLATGYPGGNDINVAMERGEVQGRCGWSWSSVVSTRPQWLQEPKYINILVQMALKKHPDMPDVPLVLDLARNPEERQLMRVVFSRQTMGRPFTAPPGVPADRVAALRYAFDQTLVDKQFLDEATKANLELNPAGGAEIESIVKEAFQTSPDQVKRLAELTKEE